MNADELYPARLGAHSHEILSQDFALTFDPSEELPESPRAVRVRVVDGSLWCEVYVDTDRGTRLAFAGFCDWRPTTSPNVVARGVLFQLVKGPASISRLEPHFDAERRAMIEAGGFAAQTCGGDADTIIAAAEAAAYKTNPAHFHALAALVGVLRGESEETSSHDQRH